MNKDQAQRIIKDTFENKFDRARFTRFIVELLNLKSLVVSDPGATFNTNQVPNVYQPFINSFEKIADYRSGEHKLDVLVIRLKRETSIERARTTQRNFIAWYLRGDCDGEMKDAALAAFVSPDEEDWRFSLIKMDYSLGEDKKGRVKISEEFTPAKRWSFLVGSNEKSHTAQSQLIDILAKDEINPTLAQLEGAFNVEKVIKEFFEKYRELFFWTKETLDELLSKDSKIRSDFETKNINTVDFCKKLLGQIVFLYFLQKKGWFGIARDADWGTGPKNFLRELFDGKHGKYKNFYNDILEPLFYEALRNDRSYDDDYYRLFNCKIPFLNGGLFDPINNYDWVHTDINLPNDLFSNLNKTKEGDTGTGVLDIFDRYNFTVKEDEPLEKEVAVDPEMLGKVFENLLEVKDRKSKGTYYTPREIVHYMCQQSLINYLDNEMEEKTSKDNIEKLIKHGEQFRENDMDLIDSLKDIPESIIRNAKLIDEKLADIKVCDPAVGSGAFLVGMMSEILRARNVLSNYIKYPNRTIYDFKRDCIENSLYGVDIDPGAVEIAKLRLWLSLVVDEEDIKDIKPLPNLDYKIMQGNSLIEDFHGISLDIEKRMKQSRFELGSNILEEENLIKDLYQKQKDYFSTLNPTEKLRKKQDIEDFILKFFSYEIQKKNIFDQEKAKVLEKELLSISRGNQQRNFFPWKLYFGDVFLLNKGFDIVIANPPYVRQEDIKEQKSILQKAGYEVFNSTSDLYTYFYEKSYQILKQNGFSCFISSNKWMRSKYGEKLRKFFKEKTTLKQIIDFNGYKVFNATVDTNILLFQKIKPMNNTVDILSIQQDFTRGTNISNYFQSHNLKMKQSALGIKCFTFGDETIMNLKVKIEKIGIPLKDWDVKINYGIKTGLNEAFIIDTPTKEQLCAEDTKSTEILKPILRGRDIKRYSYEWAGLWLITSSFDIDVPKKYPAIYRHLLQFEEKAKKRDDQGQNWWNLRACAYYPEFEKEKVIWAGVGTDRFEMALSPAGMYLREPANLMTGEKLKYLLAVIQSQLVKFFYDKIKTEVGKGTRFYVRDFIGIPISPITSENHPIVEKIEKLVDKILPISKFGDYLENPTEKAKVKEYESQIDQLVYKLYSLTEEEVKIIEEEK